MSGLTAEAMPILGHPRIIISRGLMGRPRSVDLTPLAFDTHLPHSTRLDHFRLVRLEECLLLIVGVVATMAAVCEP